MEWVSVKDRMPEDGQYVLTWGAYPIVKQAQFRVRDGEEYWDSKHAKNHWLFSKYPVTHWMPLPEPPKEVK